MGNKSRKRVGGIMLNIQIIILAAGQSRRFKDAGYMTPKPFLNIEWRNKTCKMVQHVIGTIPYVYHNNIIIATPPDSKGPADTVLKTMTHVEHSCLILDCDILNHTNDLFVLSKMQD